MSEVHVNMGPKPTITYHDDRELLNAAMQKRLQNRLKQLQSSPKDGPSNTFSAFCDGVKFVPFESHQRNNSEQCIFEKPLLHTFWNATSDVEEYRLRTQPQIVQWLSDVEKLGGCAECLVVFCITAEVRAAKKKVKAQGDVEERLRNDFKGRVIVKFHLSASNENRLADSFQSFTNTLNGMCVSCLEQLTKAEAKQLSNVKEEEIPFPDFYSFFVRQINLAVAYEMILQDSNALEYFNAASCLLEVTLSRIAKTNKSVVWLDRIASSPCTSWDYPALIETNRSWKYLPAIENGSCPLLHIRTFLLSRQARLLFALDKGWNVSQTCISTLHAMSRERKELKALQAMPVGAVESWAYMTCFEAIQAIMTQSNPDSLMSAASSFLHVRAELWDYAHEKLRTLGLLCGLMPKGNCNTELIKAIQSGITKHPELTGFKEQSSEDHGQNLINLLQSQQAFKTSYLTLGEMVIGAYKHAGRRRMAFKVGSVMAEFHIGLGLWVEAEQLLSDACSYYSEDQWSYLFVKAYSLLAECQCKLRMEDKCVSTMALLASVPALNIIDHDPVIWMEKIMQISKNSVYQKLLSWEPLVTLEKIFVQGNKAVYTLKDEVIVEVDLKYNGPKEMKFTIASMTYSVVSSVLIKQTSPSSSITPVKSELEDLNLDDGADTLSHSRPIGMLNKRYRSLDGSSGRNADAKQKVTEFCLRNREVVFQPGHNKVILSGKANNCGQYTPAKISLISGSLDFTLPLLEDEGTTIISIEPCEPGVSVSLDSDIGVFLVGYPLKCTLSFQAGSGTTIPSKSKANVIFIGVCEVKMHTLVKHIVTSDENQTDVLLELPEILPFATLSIQLTIFIPNGIDSLEEVLVYCNWSQPVHIAKVPITLERPFCVQSSEHAGGEYTYLQLNVSNTCSIPLEFNSFGIDSKMALVCLQKNLSAILYPSNTVSSIWQCCADEMSSPVRAICSFKFRPLIEGKLTVLCDFEQQISLSSMQIEYQLSVQASPGDDSSFYAVNSSLLLKYDIKGVFPKKKTVTLLYAVVADKAVWEMGAEQTGDTTAPNSEQSVSVTIKAIPKISGFLSMPHMVLSYPDSPTELTEAQVYNLSMGEVIRIG